VTFVGVVGILVFILELQKMDIPYILVLMISICPAETPAGHPYTLLSLDFFMKFLANKFHLQMPVFTSVPSSGFAAFFGSEMNRLRALYSYY
jgi:hypothetical protein